MIKYSVLFLFEQDNPEFSNFIEAVNDLFVSRRESFEIIVIANGIEGQLRGQTLFGGQHPEYVHLFSLNRKISQSVCLRSAFKESTGEIIVLLGSYQQISMRSLNGLTDSLDENTDVVAPWREGRVDPAINQFQSRLYNAIVRKITKIQLHDLSCTVKIVRRHVLENLELYGNMHLFLPILAHRKGYSFKEVRCEHYQERGKTGIYKFSEYYGRFIDIITLYFNTYFTRKPLRFFGSLGMFFFLIGFSIVFVIFLNRLLLGLPVGENPLFVLLGFLLVALGVQSSAVGLLGEIIVFIYGRSAKEFTVSYIVSDVYSGPERRTSVWFRSPHFDGYERRKTENP